MHSPNVSPSRPSPTNREPPPLYTTSATSESEPQELLIAVMGATGTGKSTFINLVTGANFGVSDSLKSCTTDVSYSPPIPLFGRRIILMDTPGFDDTTRSDADILKTIATHLSSTYKSGIKLSGIIYLHRISDFKMSGVHARNLTMFRKLCGDETLHNVVVVTNMWSVVDRETAERRERELKEDDLLFKPVLERGARMVRHDNGVESARAVVKSIMENRPIPLLIQRELVDEGKGIDETSAGKELAKELEEVMKQQQEELDAIQKDLDEAMEAKDTESQQELEEARQELARRMERSQRDRQKLSEERSGVESGAKEAIARLTQELERERERDQTQARIQQLNREIYEGERRAAADRARLARTMEAMEERNRDEGGVFQLIGAVGGAVGGAVRRLVVGGTSRPQASSSSSSSRGSRRHRPVPEAPDYI